MAVTLWPVSGASLRLGDVNVRHADIRGRLWTLNVTGS